MDPINWNAPSRPQYPPCPGPPPNRPLPQLPQRYWWSDHGGYQVVIIVQLNRLHWAHITRQNSDNTRRIIASYPPWRVKSAYRRYVKARLFRLSIDWFSWSIQAFSPGGKVRLGLWKSPAIGKSPRHFTGHVEISKTPSVARITSIVRVSEEFGRVRLGDIFIRNSVKI